MHFPLVRANAHGYGVPDSATTGPILLQSFVQYFFQGVILSQGIKFFARFPNDSVILRTYVAVLVLLAVLQTALETYKVWLDVIVRVHWWTTPLHSVEYLLNGVICTLCEIFLIRRCWKFTGKNWWLLLVLAAISVTACVGNIDLTVRIAQEVGSRNEYEDPLTASTWAFATWVYGSLVSSLTVTTILSIYLWRAQTGLSLVDKTIMRIIEITWESAALPCVCFILGAALYSSTNVRESTHVRHIDAFFVIAAGKLYTLGIMRTINCRQGFRERLASTADDPSFGRHSLSGFQWDQSTEEHPNNTELIARPSMAHRGQNAPISPFEESSIPKSGIECTISPSTSTHQ